MTRRATQNSGLPMTALSKKYFLLVVCFFWCCPLTLMAQASQPRIDDGKWARGYNGFALICRSLGLEPESSVSEWKNRPAEKRILVVFGSGRGTRNLPVDLDRFVRNGGALLFASDGAQTLFERIRLIPSRFLHTRYTEDSFNQYDDCPIVSDFGNHPVVSGVSSVATNLSGGILFSGNDWRKIATLPKMRNQRTRLQFMVMPQDSSDRKMLICSDQSVFCNQMLFHLDNALLALQAMHWLKDGQRDSLLIMIDGQIANPDDPQSVDVEFPAPSREQILDALQQLPPDVLLRFGSEIATIIEDENLINEMMSMTLENVSDTKYFRAIIFFSTLLLAGFLFYRYLASESTIQDVVGTDTQVNSKPGSGWLGKRRQAALDRHAVARELVTRFYVKVSAGECDQFSGFPAGIRFVNGDQSDERTKKMQRTGKALKWKSRRWWTQVRLRAIRAQIDEWEHLLKNQQLVYGSLSDSGNPNRFSDDATSS